ncbi:MAG: 1-deoxy-D-xylulose-5-phosphate synthase [Gammaproteobacteria bacterium]|nr:1-deoxy-D-xylulose-5-phosphate synthase [Gammaproteobacteria bacterium]
MTTDTPYSLLEKINLPADLRKLAVPELRLLATELRAYLIDCISDTGGHLASGLGTIELTIALHYVFNTPADKLIWDVGHQSYPHKILTGRRQQMHTLRQAGGLAGFPKREESPYDAFTVGHSSTSISAALGMAIATAQQHRNNKAIAIIGDGAMTAGQAFEALNHAGDLHRNLLVILNDNDMSISPNVGAMSNYLARILSSRTYTAMRQSSKNVLKTIPTVHELARRAEEHMKGMVIPGPGTLFEEMGFNYIGPIDGHDIDTLVNTLRNLRSLNGPQLLHIITRKGKGYHHAEQDPCRFHGVASFNQATGKNKQAPCSSLTYTQVFSDWICDQGQQDENLIAITPAMREGSGLVNFSEQFPERYFDVGIAEQHCLTMAAGMACEGMRPVVAIYSTFLQRAYDQLIHDIALPNLPVTLAIDRGGLVGADGPTHAGSFDLSFLRCVPNLLIMAPANENECRQMLTTAHHWDGPAAVRYPRGQGPGTEIIDELQDIDIGKAIITRQGNSKIAILSFGSLLNNALDAADKLDLTVVNMRFIKPLDETLLISIATEYEILVTLEDNVIAGGAGSAVNELLAKKQLNIPVLNLGLPDIFVEHASREQQLIECGLDTNGIIRSIEERLSRLNPDT